MQKRIPQILLFCLIIFETFSSNSQEKIDITAGVSFPEGYNLGLRYKYFTNRRIDFHIGRNIPFETYLTSTNFSINHAFYFGKVKNKANRKLWSFNQGFTFLLLREKNSDTNIGLLSLNFSREFMLSEKLFIEPKLGANYLLYHKVLRVINPEGYIIRFSPNFGLGLGLKI